jgi:hypothetical protein
MASMIFMSSDNQPVALGPLVAKWSPVISNLFSVSGKAVAHGQLPTIPFPSEIIAPGDPLVQR